MVSTSKPIPLAGTAEDKDDNPPHRQAAAYHKTHTPEKRFKVTMEHPSVAAPEKLVVEIDGTMALGGEVIPSAGLAIPKARELARFLALGLDRAAALFETRRIGNTEVLIVSLSELEIGQAPQYPILDEERFALCFTPEDEFAPQVLALRTDFPDAPHINRSVDEIPRSLCLYDGPYDEVKLSWTAGRFIERIRVWIRDTARGALHRNDQPLEPVLLSRRPIR
jgi:hypothetical protein